MGIGDNIARFIPEKPGSASHAGAAFGIEFARARNPVTLHDDLHHGRRAAFEECNRSLFQLRKVRARLDQAGFRHVTITVSGGLTPDRIRYFLDAGAPVDSFAVGSYISGATPIDFTGDIKEIDGQPIAKRGRIPGRTESPRLKRVNLQDWRGS